MHLNNRKSVKNYQKIFYEFKKIKNVNFNLEDQKRYTIIKKKYLIYKLK